MELNTKFSLIIDKLNKKITEINILLSKDNSNEALKNELNLLLKDRDLFFKGTNEQLKEMADKIDENNLNLIDKFYYNYIHWKHKHERDIIEYKEQLDKYRTSEGKTYKYTLFKDNSRLRFLINSNVLFATFSLSVGLAATLLNAPLSP